MNILKGTTWAAVVIAGSFVLGACGAEKTTVVQAQPNVYAQSRAAELLDLAKTEMSPQDITDMCASYKADPTLTEQLLISGLNSEASVQKLSIVFNGTDAVNFLSDTCGATAA